MASHDALARLESGEAWAEFCDTLKNAGEVVLRDSLPLDPIDRAEGWRYLTRLVRTALEQHLEFADPLAPEFRRPSHETVKIGADNPDNHYQSATIDGAHRYRITGARNTVHYLGLGTYAGGYGSSGRSGQTGYIDDASLELDPDGRFEINVSVDRASGNWLPMERDSTTLIVRQTFERRADERTADLRIERIGGDAPAPLTPDFLDAGLRNAAAYVRGTATLFTGWSEGFAQHPNVLPLFDPSTAAAAHGDPNILYFHGYFELGPDEALQIDFTPPPCDYWNFQLNNHWMESLDYRYHRIALNHAEAVREGDGSVRLLVCAHDPGHANWLETTGHRRGTMCLRVIGASTTPEPTTRVVKLPAR